MIPDLTDEGLLPPGIHRTNINEVIKQFGTGSLTRANISHNLSVYFQKISRYAIGVYIDGSFVSGKFAPNDVDVLVIYPPDIDFDRNPELKKLQFMYRNSEKKYHKIDNYHARANSEKEKSGLEWFQKTRSGKEKGILYMECEND
jgi:hypothetical protein